MEKGKAKAAIPEPPPRSAPVRKLVELLDGLHPSSTSTQQPKSETRKATTVLGARASADREGTFCQGTSAALDFYRCLQVSFVSQSTIYHCSPNWVVQAQTRSVGVWTGVLVTA